MLTQEEIDKLRKFYESGTRGPWKYGGSYSQASEHIVLGGCMVAPGHRFGDFAPDHELDANGELVARMHNLLPSLLSAAEVGLKLSDAVREWDKATVEYDRACLNCEGRLAFDLADARRDAAVTALHTLAKSLPPTTSTRSE